MMVRLFCIVAVLVFPLCVSAQSSADGSVDGSSASEEEAPAVTPWSGTGEWPGREDGLLSRSLQEESALDRGRADGEQGRLLLAEADKADEDVPGEDESSPDEGGATEDTENTRIADPLYYWNVAMYHFNDKLYFWVLKPAAQGYSAVAPEPVRLAVSHFFKNLTTPVRFVANLLQLKLENAGYEFVRFVTNSTQGVAGLFDVAKTHYGMSGHDEDIGQALGSYGIGQGFYLVLPFFGPSSLRDAVGLVGDLLLDPVTYVTPLEASIGIRAYDMVNETSFRIGDYETAKEAAIDPYVAIRNGYVQKRKKEVEE